MPAREPILPVDAGSARAWQDSDDAKGVFQIRTSRRTADNTGTPTGKRFTAFRVIECDAVDHGEREALAASRRDGRIVARRGPLAGALLERLQSTVVSGVP